MVCLVKLKLKQPKEVLPGLPWLDPEQLDVPCLRCAAARHLPTVPRRAQQARAAARLVLVPDSARYSTHMSRSCSQPVHLLTLLDKMRR